MVQAVGVGVVGMGWMGMVHSRAYLQAAERFYDTGIRAKLIICADHVEERAKEAQKRFGFERTTTRWQGVIADPDVRVVNITTPNYLHREVAAAAAAAGKHVFCEKPVGKSPQETAEVERLTRQAASLHGSGTTIVGFR